MLANCWRQIERVSILANSTVTELCEDHRSEGVST